MTDFLFLRPAWLLGTLACIIAMVRMYRIDSAKSGWWELMDNHIGRALILARGSHKLLTPLNLLLALIGAICIGLAGPSFDKQLPDELQGKASVVVLLANGESMYAGDVSPNRNRVAKQKIRELRQALTGSQFALVAYAHSAHQVAPLTADPKFMDLYLDPLEPGLMPERQQKTPGLPDALNTVLPIVEHARYPTNIVLMTDQLNDQDVSDIVQFQQQQQIDIEVLAIGTTQGGTLRFVDDKQADNEVNTAMALAPFEALKQQGVAVLGVTQSNDDVAWLAAQIEHSVTKANNRNPAFDWRDAGYLLAWLFVPLCLPLFRKKSWALSVAPLLLVLTTGFSQPAQAMTWDELWWSADQLGQQALEQGDFASAASHFEDPYRKGWSLYQIGEFKQAEAQFSQVETAEGYFYLANALAQQQKYKEAMEAYGHSARLDGTNPALDRNLALVKARLAASNKVNANKRQVEDDGQIMLQVGAKGKVERKELHYLDPMSYSEEELNLWLGKVKSSPEKLLKSKFELQSQRKMVDAL